MSFKCRKCGSVYCANDCWISDENEDYDPDTDPIYMIEPPEVIESDIPLSERDF